MERRKRKKIEKYSRINSDGKWRYWVVWSRIRWKNQESQLVYS